ncbi:MAG: outer membrane receptor protein, partial [Bacteroidaceae bacterium]|nr:outer membrane receptor protein [Bacteroidaceae bacterium]
IYTDPRVSTSIHIPHFILGDENVKTTLTAGYGMTSKMPTMQYLYPDPYYSNFLSLTYYDLNNPTTDSRFVVTSFIQDPTNYNIKPARNKKLDLRLDFDWKDNSLSLGFFHENMTDGFRYSATYNVYSYRYFDASAYSPETYGTIAWNDISNGNVPLNYTSNTVLDGYTKAGNGTRIMKKGVELTFNSARIRPLCTRINVSGAWFLTEYTNSEAQFESVSSVINNTVIAQKYIGLYDWIDGRRNQRLNSNVTFDTQIPQWGFIFTTSVQCMWLVKTQTIKKNGTPIMYLSAQDGQLHEYTEQDTEDVYLQQLIKSYSEDSFKPFNVPMSMTVNLKATKTIGKNMNLSFFANKILDYLPDYKSNGNIIRRNVKPYFGVEANIKL